MDIKNFEIDLSAYESIAQIIHSETSPVGIDAKKTHIIILHKLNEISERLKRIEDKLETN